MRKKNLLLIALLTVVLMVALTACSESKPITADEFKSTMESEGYKINDITSQYAKYDFISCVVLAYDADKTYQIEFYEMKNEESAQQSYENNRANFEASKGSVFGESSLEGKNSASYSLTSNGEYKYVARVGNTMVYVDVPKEKKDAVKAAMDKIGY